MITDISVVFYSWRIQTKKNCQDTPNGSNIDLFAGIYHTVVTLSKQEDTQSIHCKIHKPLVLQKKPQHWKQKQNNQWFFLLQLTKSAFYKYFVKCYEICAHVNWVSSHSLVSGHYLFDLCKKKCLFYQEHPSHWLEFSPSEGQYLWALLEACSPHSVFYEHTDTKKSFAE